VFLQVLETGSRQKNGKEESQIAELLICEY
jgi:hypothetical protein